VRHGEDPLPDGYSGQDGLDEIRPLFGMRRPPQLAQTARPVVTEGWKGDELVDAPGRRLVSAKGKYPLRVRYLPAS
jgi:hypothetical protein